MVDRYDVAAAERDYWKAEAERLRATAARLANAYRTFVDEHGPLVDYSTSAEMVDLDIALAAAFSEEQP